MGVFPTIDTHIHSKFHLLLFIKPYVSVGFNVGSIFLFHFILVSSFLFDLEMKLMFWFFIMRTFIYNPFSPSPLRTAYFIYLLLLLLSI